MPPSEEKLEKRAKNILLHQLTRSAKTERQLRDVLLKREIPQELIDWAIGDFLAAGLIDDESYAKGFLAARLAKGKSVKLIARELRQKGVADSIIEDVCSSVSAQDQQDLADELARRRIMRMAALAPDVRYRRLSGFLMRRGFPSSVVSAAVRAAENQR
jgi:regulatory protein